MEALTTLAPQSPRRSLAALERLRARLRRLFVSDGVASVLLALLAASAASFLLDYSLHLPAVVRGVFLALGLAGLVSLLSRRLLQPISRPVGDADLAKLVERANPHLQESFLTAVELTRPGSESAAYVSPALLDAVVESVEERVSKIQFERVFDLRGLLRKWSGVGLALVIVLGALLGSGAFRAFAAIWLSRNVLLSAEAWPREVELRLVSPASSPAVVAVGDPLEVAVEVVRGAPPAVLVESTPAGGRTVRIEPMAESGSAVYRKVFANVSRPFQFSVRAGDDALEPVSVEVRLRPRIDTDSVRLWCTYPPYTGIPATPEDTPIRYGNLKVPTGTEVRYAMATNVPVREVHRVFRPREGSQPADPEGVWPAPGAERLEVVNGQEFSGSFTVEASGEYFFQFETSDGFRSYRPDRFRLEAIPDRKPVVKVLRPEHMREEVSAEARVEIRASAHDDYGVRDGRIVGVYYPAGSDQGEERTFPLAGMARDGAGAQDGGAGVQDGGAGAQDAPRASRVEVEGSITLEVGRLEEASRTVPAPGARLQFYASVTDTAGNTGESRVHEIVVVAPEDLLRGLTGELMVLRDQLGEILRRQASVRTDVEEFRKKALLRERLESGDADTLLRYRQDQQRVSTALEREAKQMARLLGSMESNNVGDTKWRSWVESLSAEVSDLAARKSPGIEAGIEKLHQEAVESPQPVERVSPIIADQRALERDLEALIRRLTEFGDVNALIDMLRDVRRRQSDLRDKTRAHLGGPGREEEP
jgi:hypothetical protein